MDGVTGAKLGALICFTLIIFGTGYFRSYNKSTLYLLMNYSLVGGTIGYLATYSYTICTLYMILLGIVLWAIIEDSWN